MKLQHYITAILTAVIITAAVFIYTLHFRYNSCSYALMKLRMHLSENNKAGIESLCHLSVFCDSFMLKLPLMQHQQVVPLDTNITGLLTELHKKNEGIAYITAVYKLLQYTGGSMVNQHENASGKGRMLTQYYKLKGRDFFIGISFYFERKAGEWQLQYMDKVFVKAL